MRAVRRTERGIETVDVPVPEGDGVRVHMRSAGICGSDLSTMRAGPSPVTIGHEVAGVLDDGTAVAIDPTGRCGTCRYCLEGRHNLCRDLFTRFYGQTLDGGMAEEMLVDPANLVPLPAGITPDIAGLVEPIAISLHAVQLGGVAPGMRVLVIGAGAIGLTAVIAGRWLGADVDVVARHPHQQVAAEALGGRNSTGKDYEVVVDAVGSQAAVDDAMRLVRRGGTVVEVGGVWDGVEIGLTAMLKEVRFQPALCSAHHHGEPEFARSARILAEAPDAAAVMVTHRFPLERAAEAFAVADDKSTGAIKVHLHP